MSVDSFHKLHYLVHPSTGRGGLSTNLATIGFLPEQRRLSINNFIPERKQCKFQKDKRVIGSTTQNMMDETRQKNWRNSRK